MSNQFHRRLNAIRQAVATVPEAAVDAAARRLSAEHGVVSDAIQLIHAAAAGNEALKADVAGALTAVAGLKTELATTVTDLTGLKTELAATATDVNAIKTGLATTATDVNAVKTQVASAVSDVTGFKTTLSAAVTDVSGLKNALTATQSDVAALKVRLDGTEKVQEIAGVRLACLCALCEVAEILSRWEGDKGQEHTAELSALESKYRRSIAAVAEHHLEDWSKLCDQLAKSATPEKRAHRGQLLRKIARGVCGISD